MNQVRKRTCSRALVFAVAAALIFLFINERAIAKGILLGACFSVLNFILMGATIPYVLGRSRAGAGFASVVSILGRFALLAVPLIAGIKSPSINLAAAIIGVFSVQLVLLVDFILIRPRGEKN